MSNNGCNVPNRTIFLHDNLEVLQGLNSGCIDLIYLDPPFNKNKVFSAPIGSSAEGAEFSDIFREEDVKAEWLQTIKEDQPELYQYLNGIKGVGKSYNFAYLAYMAIRLIECKRVLKQTGSLYLHCDPTMSHYLKTTLDCIFGEENFRNEIIWMRTSRKFKGSQYEPRSFNTNTDVILFYACSSKSRLYMNRVLEPYSDTYLNRTFKFSDTHGRYYLDTAHNRPSASSRPNLCYEYRGYFPPYESGWKVGRKRMEELEQAGDLVEKNNLLYRKIRPKEGTVRTNLWSDIVESKGKERTGYPTQKPRALLKRIIEASTNKFDLVLDPFCGCATTCVAAEDIKRQWIGIDVSVKAYELVKERLEREVAHPDALPTYRNEIHLKSSPPKRTDIGASVRETKYVYIISHPKYSGEYKVGIAKDVKSRLNAYQTSDPDRSYRLEFSHETHLYRETEAYIHEYFENKHEWVRADLADIKQEILNYS